MKRSLAVLALMLLVSCGGGGQTLPLFNNQGQDGPLAEGATTAALLTLEAESAGESWRVSLAASEAQDLYQIAGTVVYDPGRYSVTDAGPGGGLGDEGTSYFAWGEREAGRIDFAYTRRYRGPGVSGDARLLELRVTPLQGFSIGDFALDTAAGALLVRDSNKQELAVSIGGEVRQ